MAKKKELDKDIEDINTNITKKKVVIGTKRTLMEMRKDNIGKIYVTLNCPEEVKEDINHYSKFSECKIVELKYHNDELGTLCKKPFAISVIGLLK